MTELPAMVSFGDGSRAWRATSSRLARQAASSNYFSRIKVHTISSLPNEDAQENYLTGNDYQAGKGFGYWRWKPRIVVDSLNNLDSKTPGVWYLDAGCTLVCNLATRARMNFYLEKGLEAGWGVGFQLGEPFTEARYTKRAVHEKFGLSRELASTGQVQATAVFFANTDLGKHVAHEWLLASKERSLFDDSDDFPRLDIPSANYVGHRHDQSVLSCILKTFGLQTLDDELNIERPELLLMPKDKIPYPILGTRHKSRFDSLSMNPAMRAIRMVEGL